MQSNTSCMYTSVQALLKARDTSCMYKSVQALLKASDTCCMYKSVQALLKARDTCCMYKSVQALLICKDTSCMYKSVQALLICKDTSGMYKSVQALLKRKDTSCMYKSVQMLLKKKQYAVRKTIAPSIPQKRAYQTAKRSRRVYYPPRIANLPDYKTQQELQAKVKAQVAYKLIEKRLSGGNADMEVFQWRGLELSKYESVRKPEDTESIAAELTPVRRPSISKKEVASALDLAELYKKLERRLSGSASSMHIYTWTGLRSPSSSDVKPKEVKPEPLKSSRTVDMVDLYKRLEERLSGGSSKKSVFRWLSLNPESKKAKQMPKESKTTTVQEETVEIPKRRLTAPEMEYLYKKLENRLSGGTPSISVLNWTALSGVRTADEEDMVVEQNAMNVSDLEAIYKRIEDRLSGGSSSYKVFNWAGLGTAQNNMDMFSDTSSNTTSTSILSDKVLLDLQLENEQNCVEEVTTFHTLVTG